MTDKITSVRFAGAQIRVTKYIKTNVITIKHAIDWAADNNVDYLVTPEASLSGYYINFEKNITELEEALREIEKYAKEKQVGLCLGTLWIENIPTEDEKTIPTKKNEIRYYSKEGNFLGCSSKTVMTKLDIEIGIEPSNMLTGILLPVGDAYIPTAGLICADIYGWGGSQGGLPQKYHDIGAKLFIHSTNAERDIDPNAEEIEQLWLEAWLRKVSLMQQCPIIVADNTYKMDGSEYDKKTMTQSGMLINGMWVTNVERYGTQYFYYDLPVDDMLIKFED